MITLHFSECGHIPTPGIEIKMPLITRLRGPYYEELLRNALDDEYKTYDELCVLVAQWLHAHKERKVRLVSWCLCGEKPKKATICLDDDGSPGDHPWHGFFGQRLKYLR